MVGQKILMGCGFLERRVVTCNSLFNRQLTGKKQAFEKFIHWILGGYGNPRPLQRNIRQKHPKFPTRDNREISGKKQAKQQGKINKNRILALEVEIIFEDKT